MWNWIYICRSELKFSFVKDINLKCVKNVTFGDIVTLYCHIHSHIISNQVLFGEKGSSSDKKEGW